MAPFVKCTTVQELEERVRNLGIQKPTRRFAMKLRAEIYTDEMKHRADEYNQKYRELKRKGPKARVRRRKLWESIARRLNNEMLERAESRGPAGLAFLEGWLEEKVTEHGEAKARKNKSWNFIREGLDKAYLRESLSALSL